METLRLIFSEYKAGLVSVADLTKSDVKYVPANYFVVCDSRTGNVFRATDMVEKFKKGPPNFNHQVGAAKKKDIVILVRPGGLVNPRLAEDIAKLPTQAQKDNVMSAIRKEAQKTSHQQRALAAVLAPCL